MEELRTYICLFDLKPYDDAVAPALRRYVRDFDPGDVVKVLEKLADTGESADFKHWIDAIREDKGYKPSDQTVQELSDIVIRGACFPHEPGLNPVQEADVLLPWLESRSEWFADMMDDGEQLAGGRLEFGYGSGRLVATREQILQFSEELQALEAPQGAFRNLAADFLNLRKIVERALAVKSYTLLKTAMEKRAG